MKRKKLFQVIEENRILQIVVFCILMAAIYVLYSTISLPLERRFEVVSDDYYWVYQVDEIEEVGNKIVLSGFAFRINRDAKKAEYEIILCNTRTGKRYFPTMSYMNREDVNEYFQCDFDYTQTGFLATISSKKLDLKNEAYEVLLRPAGEKKAYSTGIYYAENKMMFTNPEEFVPLETSGTDLEKIIRDGVLRVYRPDVGMYVYQYANEVYWVAESDYGFVDEDTTIQFQMNTTQVQNLPQHRLEEGKPWDDIHFKFSSKELIGFNFGNYRVAKCALPNNYSIREIWTGHYNDEWTWIQYFRPWYEFVK